VSCILVLNVRNAKGMVYVAVVMVCHVGSCGEIVECSWAWEDVRCIVCSPS
jgi:hypothetical protein